MSLNEFDISRGGWLAGRKTYITAVTGIVTALGAYLIGEMDLVQTFQTIWPLIAAAFLRNGVSNGQ
jgi:hypothetical protein